MKRHKKVFFIYHIGHVTVKDFSHAKTNSVNVLYLSINKINSYIEESNRNIYLTLVSTDEGKDSLKL